MLKILVKANEVIEYFRFGTLMNPPRPLPPGEGSLTFCIMHKTERACGNAPQALSV
jgi:hypothetical protein